MTEPTHTLEPREARAANWLNSVMWYALASLLTLASLSSFLGSFHKVRVIFDAPALSGLDAIPREVSATFTLVGVAILLAGWRRWRAVKR